MLWSADAIAARMRKHLEAFGLNRGQSMHGFRRGTMQHQVHVEGKPRADVQARVGIKTGKHTSSRL